MVDLQILVMIFVFMELQKYAKIVAELAFLLIKGKI